MIEKNASIRCNTCSTNITANYSTIVRIELSVTKQEASGENVCKNIPT